MSTYIAGRWHRAHGLVCAGVVRPNFQGITHTRPLLNSGPDLAYCTWAPTSPKGGTRLMDLYVLGWQGPLFKELHTQTSPFLNIELDLTYCTWAPTSPKGGTGLIDLYVLGSWGPGFLRIQHTRPPKTHIFHHCDMWQSSQLQEPLGCKYLLVSTVTAPPVHYNLIN